MIFPLKDVRFASILKRIIRGLSHYHELDTAIPETSVACEVMQFMIPPEIEKEMNWNVIAPSFIRYTFSEWICENVRSAWIVEIGTQMQFLGWVATSPNNAIQADALGPADL